MRIRLFVITMILVFLPQRWAFGVSQSVTGYIHDKAGNTTRIVNEANTQPPAVTSLDPNAVRRIATNRITAFGANLKNAQVTSAEAAIKIATLASTASQVIFDLTAAETVTPGDYPLTFTTRLGSATVTLTITEAMAPQLTVSPNPVALGSNGDSVKLSFTLSAPDSLTNTLTFSVADPLVAKISPAETVIAKGAMHSSDVVTVTGVVEGKTTLTVNAAQLNSVQIPVEVVTRYQYPPGEHNISSAILGINRAYAIKSPNVLNVYSKSLTVNRIWPNGILTQADNAYSRSLTIERTHTLKTSVVDNTNSSTLGIKRTWLNTPSVQADNAYAQIGLFWGSSIYQITPTLLIAGTNNPLNIRGKNLQLVTQVTLDPANGAVIDPALEISPDGTQLTVHIIIADGTPTAIRKLVVMTSKGPAVFTQTSGDQVQIQ